jgi:hypothetical protein
LGAQNGMPDIITRYNCSFRITEKIGGYIGIKEISE